MKYVDKECEVCGAMIYNVHKGTKYCLNCRLEKNKEHQRKRDNKNKLSFDEFHRNFFNVVKESFALTNVGFDEVSKISSRSYVVKFNHEGLKYTWIDIIKYYNKYEELVEYVAGEYGKYLQCNNTPNTLKQFPKHHKYINHQILKNIDLDSVRSSAGERQSRYTLDDCIYELIELKNNYKRIPLYNEFMESAQISITVYKRCFNTGKYDEMVKRVFNPDEFDEYLENKKEHKAKVGKTTCTLNKNLISEDDLKEELIRVFEYFKTEYGEYPSSRLFNAVAKYDESTYRRKLNMKWSEVCNYFGYEIDDKNTGEIICLSKISKILNSTYEPQKTFDWLIGIKNFPLFCDGYFPEHNLIVEFDGLQHFKPIKKYGGEKTFKTIWANDRVKDDLIPNHGYKLLRIDSRDNWFDDEYLINKLKQLKIQL